MFNMPKCKSCKYYETNTGDVNKFTSHACYSPKYQPGSDPPSLTIDEACNSAMGVAIPKEKQFNLSKHCDYNKKR